MVSFWVVLSGLMLRLRGFSFIRKKLIDIREYFLSGSNSATNNKICTYEPKLFDPKFTQLMHHHQHHHHHHHHLIMHSTPLSPAQNLSQSHHFQQLLSSSSSPSSDVSMPFFTIIISIIFITINRRHSHQAKFAVYLETPHNNLHSTFVHFKPFLVFFLLCRLYC